MVYIKLWKGIITAMLAYVMYIYIRKKRIQPLMRYSKFYSVGIQYRHASILVDDRDFENRIRSFFILY